MAEKETTTTVPDLALEYVSKLMGRKVVSFTIKPGTAPGDNYMSVLYCFKCALEGHEVMYGISKCYPSHPFRQSFLNKSNIFWNELQIYQNFIPTLKTFQADLGLNMKFPFAPLISGEAVDFGTGKVNEEGIAKYAGRIFSPFENYLMMVDLKNTYDFRMANRFVGLAMDEVSLVMREHSKLHALSWAYKLKNGIKEISEKMPYMEFQLNKEDMDMWMNVMVGSCQNGIDNLKAIGNVNPAILDGFEKFKGNLQAIMNAMFEDKTAGPALLETYLRVKPNKDAQAQKDDEKPWRVVVHGDCWINNLLFRYDEVTKKAVELVLIDLQMMREACPTMDLVYLIYTSTTSEFRAKHLEEVLKLYYTNFKSYCDQLGVEYLPGFSFEGLKRRFHASKLMGFTMAVMALPIMLKEAKDVMDMEKMKADANLGDMMEAMTEGVGDNKLYKERLLGVCTELFNEGVI